MENKKRTEQNRKDFLSSTNDNKDIRDIKKNFYFILKKTNYKNISFLGILKTLWKVHKISKYDYKDSIKRLLRNKPLRSKVYSLVHFYLSTLKSSTSKSTLTALNKQDHRKQYQRFFIVKYQNQSYAVTVKKVRYMEIVYNKYLSDVYKNLMIKAIKEEFKVLMGGLQDEIIIY